MATDNNNDRSRTALIRELGRIAEGNPTPPGVDGTTRIKAAVMLAYLQGRPAPTREPALTGFLQLQQEFGIQLTNQVNE